MRRLPANQRRARRRRVSLKDGAIRQVKPSAARRVDDHRFHDSTARLGVERLVSIIDEDRRILIQEHEVCSLRRIQNHIGRVHEEHLLTEPRLRHAPRRHVFRLDENRVTLLNQRQEDRIFLLALKSLSYC